MKTLFCYYFSFFHYQLRTENKFIYLILIFCSLVFRHTDEKYYGKLLNNIKDIFV